ncbi:hypothetical protein FSOLCH5_010606 [Fusarium solani]|uniref:Transcription elongation factor 1 homolog n=9 Tax=Fusarium solani species complex TaxID=232080 RepID=A0A428PG06_9HYPO|nr:transcription elongation factor Elf1 like-domain-containing protein [Fusarium solani]XP_052909215.1 Transcription elongation factor 1-like protein [Fusarium keratoplasticum]XP_053012457.1 Transcription elongation factor 1-like protein [Fusarium falciforme]KAI8659293.1 Transcription elongation factor 1-like protein [Fusarium sp. Ph1]KAJ4328475.1 hypothetical protein N0V84_001159 [Fusarium piperis]RSL41266.1 hypothetical protein CEP53_012855 [Fusarium sp. AF-6]RSL51946.1 hypothetical protein
MGKRKSSKKPMGPKKSDPLPTTFACLFCNHENSVSVKLDKKAGVGQLDCRICGQKFQCAVNYLSAAVDVYGEWVDAADSVAKGESADAGYTGTSRGAGSGRAAGGRSAVDNDEDDRRSYEGEYDDY